MFSAPGEEMGVHVWHVERYAGWRSELGVFGDAEQEDLGFNPQEPAIVEPDASDFALGAVARWSALVVTEEGKGMFGKRWGAKEVVGGYRDQIVVGGVLREREEWERGSGVCRVEGWGGGLCWLGETGTLPQKKRPIEYCRCSTRVSVALLASRHSGLASPLVLESSSYYIEKHRRTSESRSRVPSLSVGGGDGKQRTLKSLESGVCVHKCHTDIVANRLLSTQFRKLQQPGKHPLNPTTSQVILHAQTLLNDITLTSLIHVTDKLHSSLPGKGPGRPRSSAFLRRVNLPQICMSPAPSDLNIQLFNRLGIAGNFGLNELPWLISLKSKQNESTRKTTTP